VTVTVIRMTATQKSDAPALRDDFDARLRLEVYDALAATKGAPTVVAQARLHGIHRATLFRIRSGERAPSLELALKMAADLSTTVEALFELSDMRTHPPSGPQTPAPPPGPPREEAA
jgi:DNA-binding XRE family transcriptional regulator